MRKNEGLCWCVYHDHLLSYCHGFAERTEDIKRTKASKEVPIRLYEMRFVKGKLPKKILQAYIAWRKIRVNFSKLHNKQQKIMNRRWEKTEKEWDTINEKIEMEIIKWDRKRVNLMCELYDIAEKCQPALEILHKKEVPDTCWDGEKLNFKKSKKE